MLLKELRHEVLEKCLQMIRDGLAFGSGGNISALDRDSGLIAITPSALEYTKMKPEDVVVVDKHGKLVEGNWKPTSESPMHTIFYREREDVGAVMHTHAPHASVFAIINEPIPMVVTESALCLGAQVRVDPYVRPGTDDLARSVLEAMGQDVAILLGQHGLITVGQNLGEAYASTIAAEVSARFTIMARSMGVEPMHLDLEEVRFLRDLYLTHYHPTKGD
ncbi:MAG: class II aldolase/adducin family protein [Anaerolineales bacterium]|nr:MAG: class II aldolase/adducin family protein [Anaerolineales bacterium]